MRNAIIVLTVICSLTRQMVSQSLNDLEAVFICDGYCNSLRASAFYQDSVFFSVSAMWSLQLSRL